MQFYSTHNANLSLALSARCREFKHIWRVRLSIPDVLSFLDEISMKYESPMRLWFGPQMVVFIADAENAEIVLKSKDCLNKPYDFYKILRDALNVDGFFTLKGRLKFLAYSPASMAFP